MVRPQIFKAVLQDCCLGERVTLPQNLQLRFQAIAKGGGEAEEKEKARGKGSVWLLPGCDAASI